MNSLRVRLLLAMSAAIFIVWALWMGLLYLDKSREQSGWWDETLRATANQILTSMPRDIDAQPSGSRTLALPAGVDSGLEHLSFQVWILPGTGARGTDVSGTNALRSRQSPVTPLRPDFRVGFGIEEIDGTRWRVYAVSDAGGRVQVQTGRPVKRLAADLGRWVKASLVTAVLLFVVLGIALKLVIGWSLRAVTRLQKDLAARREFDLDPLPTAGLPGEIRPLIESFNRLLDRVDRAIRGERQFIADAAHELRTPLAAVQAHAQVALRTGNPEDMRQSLNRLVGAVERGTRLAQQLLDSARLEAGQRGGHDDVDLAEVVDVVTHEFDMTARQRRQTIALETLPCTVRGDTDELGILVRNLIDNALRYSSEGGRVAVICRPETDEPGTTLQVLDDGPGVPKADRARIFDRFFRGEGNGQRGSGIGLSLVQRIARSHGARIELGAGLGGRGLGVTIRFSRA